MPNMKNGTILDTEKNKIDLGDSPMQNGLNVFLLSSFQKDKLKKMLQKENSMAFSIDGLDCNGQVTHM